MNVIVVFCLILCPNDNKINVECLPPTSDQILPIPAIGQIGTLISGIYPTSGLKSCTRFPSKDFRN